MTPGTCFPDLPPGFFVRWFQQHGRAFPWRHPGTSPYGVLVAEMLLRQTRASMVAPVWIKLVQQYPEPQALASADPEALYQLIRPLGFGQQRVAALQSMARVVVERFGGVVPNRVEDLESLPHVGPYTARAVCCFAFGQPLAVVDSNVLRVLSRLAGWRLSRDIRRSSARCAWDAASRLVPARAAREHNYGLLDFAAEICKPVKPRCAECPLAGQCCYASCRVRGAES